MAGNKCSLKICRSLDSNRGPLVSEATALPTEPQPLLQILPRVGESDLASRHPGFLRKFCSLRPQNVLLAAAAVAVVVVADALVAARVDERLLKDVQVVQLDQEVVAVVHAPNGFVAWHCDAGGVGLLNVAGCRAGSDDPRAVQTLSGVLVVAVPAVSKCVGHDVPELSAVARESRSSF